MVGCVELQTALIIAVQRRNKRMVLDLILAGTRVDLRDRNGEVPLPTHSCDIGVAHD